MTSYSASQQALLAILPKITAGIGLPSAALLSYYIISDHWRGRGNPMLRALLGVSFYEMLDAVGWFMSTWAVPRSSGWAFASGNQASCSFQGFLLQVVIGAPLSSCALAFFFYAVAIHEVSTQALVNMEKYIHFSIFFYAVFTSLLLLILDQYNQVGAVCWVVGSPSGCENSSYQGNSEVPCERGNWAWVFGMVLFYIPLWICILCIVFFNLSIYYKKLRNTGEGQWFAVQSVLYGCAFLITWAPSTLWSIVHWNDSGGFVFDVLSALFEPLAGFWNLLIFLRNRESRREQLWNLLLCKCHKLIDDKDVRRSSSSSKKKNKKKTKKNKRSKQSNNDSGDNNGNGTSSCSSGSNSNSNSGRDKVDQAVAQGEKAHRSGADKGISSTGREMDGKMMALQAPEQAPPVGAHKDNNNNNTNNDTRDNLEDPEQVLEAMRNNQQSWTWQKNFMAAREVHV